jgi:hypothetical protein
MQMYHETWTRVQNVVKNIILGQNFYYNHVSDSEILQSYEHLKLQIRIALYGRKFKGIG